MVAVFKVSIVSRSRWFSSCSLSFSLSLSRSRVDSDPFCPRRMSISTRRERFFSTSLFFSTSADCLNAKYPTQLEESAVRYLSVLNRGPLSGLPSRKVKSDLLRTQQGVPSLLQQAFAGLLCTVKNKYHNFKSSRKLETEIIYFSL